MYIGTFSRLFITTFSKFVVKHAVLFGLILGNFQSINASIQNSAEEKEMDQIEHRSHQYQQIIEYLAAVLV